MEDDDAPGPEGGGGVAAADAATRGADTSELEAALSGEGEELQVERADDGQSPDEEPAPPSDSADEQSLSSVDPEDPETWPEETRKAVGGYKSRLDLAKAVVENRRTFQTELDRRVAEEVEKRSKGGKEPSAPAARVEERGEEGPPPAEVVALQGEMSALADQFDAGLKEMGDVQATVKAGVARIAELRGVVADLDDQIKTEEDELMKDRLVQRRDRKIRELDTTESSVELGRLKHERMESQLTKVYNRYHSGKATVAEHMERARTVEERRLMAEESLDAATQAQETSITSALEQARRSLNVPDAKQARFDTKLLRALHAQPGDVEDLPSFFAKEGREELRDWAMSKAEGAVSYGADKRKDTEQRAPAAVAKAALKPMSRRDADRIAAQGSRRIPIG